MLLTPNEHYRYSFKKGMIGWDVAAIQIALNAAGISANLVEDGSFGPLTEAAAKKLQSSLHVTEDGIVGPQTQGALCARECARAEVHVTPTGLLKGICFGESSGIIPATSPEYPTSKTHDVGPLQDNIPIVASQQEIKDAFSPPLQAKLVGQERKTKYEYYRGATVTKSRASKGFGQLSAEEAWRLAVLSYNWPAAANEIAWGNEKTWFYIEEDINGAKHYRKLSDPAPWIAELHIAGVYTGLDWAKFYVDSKVVYVTSWIVS